MFVLFNYVLWKCDSVCPTVNYHTPYNRLITGLYSVQYLDGNHTIYQMNILKQVWYSNGHMNTQLLLVQYSDAIQLTKNYFLAFEY